MWATMIREVGRGAGALDARVHIRLVVVADVHHVVAPLHGAGEALKADVVGAAVAAEGDEFIAVVQLAPLFHGLVGGLHPGEGGGGVGEGVVDEAVLPGSVGVHEGGYLQAAGGGADNGLVLRLQCPQHGADGDGGAASGAHPVSGGEAVLLHDVLFQTVAHDLSLLIPARPGSGMSRPHPRWPRCAPGRRTRAGCSPPARPGRPDRRCS